MSIQSSMLRSRLIDSYTGVVSPKYYLYQYNDNNYRIVVQKGQKEKGFELIEEYKKDFLSDEEILYNMEESKRCSISRSRRVIREYALCNDFDFFVTLTINSKNCDRFSLTDCQSLLRKLLKKLKRKNHDFKYILITEKHLDGAFHFHGLFKGINESDLVPINKNTLDKIPKKILNFISKGEEIYYHKLFNDELGFCTLSRIKSLSRVSNYITKYITKDCVINENGYCYISSHGLLTATRSEINPISLDNIPCFSKNYDCVRTFDIDFSELNRQEKLYLIYSIKDKTFKDKLLSLI